MAAKLVANSFGIKGIVPTSMLDWDGHLVTTIFLGGCNLRCPFCHNPSLIDGGDKADIPLEVLFRNFEAKQGWLDGVCVSGGEPTLSDSLPELLAYLKDLAPKVKLDTNGTQPDVLRGLINEGLVDMVAMDIKTSFKNYAKATRVGDFTDRVKESITLLVEAESRGVIAVEFRTTVVPTIVSHDDVIEIAAYLKEVGASRYYLQQFKPKEVLAAEYSTIKPYDAEFLASLANEASAFLPTSVRG
ncbi:MAG TPA: anaerobic ribonucleoside-triphosphate reductase activating protein [Candidatus Aquicultor sp.]|jgi:pyruvate formate lyase activating enzyme